MQHGDPQELPATKSVLTIRPFRKCAVVGPAYSTAKMGYVHSLHVLLGMLSVSEQVYPKWTPPSSP
eukprot:7501909-Pyramimonas_sp.AAC.3